ncbi:hypothetical protein ABT173_48150 [Streptomyces sp. NPDC001795]|uniref:hypothetical protein n=1 Tax=Streptomyces sp. NPDC001795 TaxID=3154525 RepID=UPI00331DEFAC
MLQAEAELGLRPDRNAGLLARSRSRLLGVMVEIQGPFHADLVEHLHRAAEVVSHDRVLITQTRTRDEDAAVETLPAFRSSR